MKISNIHEPDNEKERRIADKLDDYKGLICFRDSKIFLMRSNVTNEELSNIVDKYLDDYRVIEDEDMDMRVIKY